MGHTCNIYVFAVLRILVQHCVCISTTLPNPYLAIDGVRLLFSFHILESSAPLQAGVRDETRREQDASLSHSLYSSSLLSPSLDNPLRQWCKGRE